MTAALTGHWLRCQLASKLLGNGGGSLRNIAPSLPLPLLDHSPAAVIMIVRRRGLMSHSR